MTHIQDLEPTQNVELISRRILTFFNDMFLTLTARDRILGITDHRSEPMGKSYHFTTQKKKKKAFISFYFLLFRQYFDFLIKGLE